MNLLKNYANADQAKFGVSFTMNSHSLNQNSNKAYNYKALIFPEEKTQAYDNLKYNKHCATSAKLLILVQFLSSIFVFARSKPTKHENTNSSIDISRFPRQCSAKNVKFLNIARRNRQAFKKCFRPNIIEPITGTQNTIVQYLCDQFFATRSN